MPADMAPSPITATTLLRRESRSRATAMPRPAEIEVEEWAAPTGEDLVRIRLVAHVPDQPVGGRVEGVVERDREFDHSEAGAEVSARDRHGADRLGPQFVRELAELAFRQSSKIVGRANRVEKGSQYGQGALTSRGSFLAYGGDRLSDPRGQRIRARLELRWLCSLVPGASAHTVGSGARTCPLRRLRLQIERRRPGRLSVRADGDLLDPRLGFLEQGLAVLLQRLTALVDRNRVLERDVAAFEPAHDSLEFLERLLEGKGLDGRVVGHGIPLRSVPVL